CRCRPAALLYPLLLSTAHSTARGENEADREAEVAARNNDLMPPALHAIACRLSAPAPRATINVPGRPKCGRLRVARRPPRQVLQKLGAALHVPRARARVEAKRLPHAADPPLPEGSLHKHALWHCPDSP